MKTGLSVSIAYFGIKKVTSRRYKRPFVALLSRLPRGSGVSLRVVLLDVFRILTLLQSHHVRRKGTNTQARRKQGEGRGT